MVHRTIPLLSVLVLGFFSRDSHAALGGDAASIEADRVALGATREIELTPAWEAHVLRAPSGGVVREYVLPGGKVFAIAWSGPVLPDLRHLLGAYFEPYVNSPRERPAQHHLRVVSNPEWVVESAGHPQSFIGRAWLPKQLPKGFDLTTVRAW
jgi:Protein of unknown function (DUF2844)